MRISGYIAGGMQNISYFKTKQEHFLKTLSFRQRSFTGKM